MTENIITQVNEEQYAAPTEVYEDSDGLNFNSKINLNLRGVHFVITKDELMSLPESILLCLFPNGVFLDQNGEVITNLTEEDVVYVNFDPRGFQYIMDTFLDAQKDLMEMSQANSAKIPEHEYDNQPMGTVLKDKPAIIVLREELDYYVIPPYAGMNSEQIRKLKILVGDSLVQDSLIFAGLGFNPNESQDGAHGLGPAEQHLFTMLCSNGFSPTENWGVRSREPSKCVIQSLLLVRLDSEKNSPPQSPNLDPVSSNASTSTTKSKSRLSAFASAASKPLRHKKSNESQSKLLLFWRKPARKCWWLSHNVHVDFSQISGELKVLQVKIHMRRVWTLELSVIGVQ